MLRLIFYVINLGREMNYWFLLVLTYLCESCDVKFLFFYISNKTYNRTTTMLCNNFIEFYTCITVLICMPPTRTLDWTFLWGSVTDINEILDIFSDHETLIHYKNNSYIVQLSVSLIIQLKYIVEKNCIEIVVSWIPDCITEFQNSSNLHTHTQF